MIANTHWTDALRDALAAHGRAVLVVVAASAGSTPREAGAAMVVSAVDARGTIGGGHLEYEALRIARDALSGGTSSSAPWLVRFPLAARLGQCCGGVATLAFSVLDDRDTRWLQAAEAHLQDGMAFAVASTLGSTHRMVIGMEHSIGTLGEEALDASVMAQVRSRLATRAGTACIEVGGGGVLVHAVHPDPFEVLVFGNGHVGRALVRVLSVLPCHVQWIDTREHDFPDALPDNVDVIVSDAPEEAVEDAPRGAYVVAMTHSHALDYAIVEAALARDDWRYLGLIGSQSKRRQFERRLLARGAAPDALSRITCPIGSGLLKSKEPGVIAIAVAAQLLEVRQAGAAATTRAQRHRR